MRKSFEKKISVIIPVYNNAKGLKDVLNSVVKQNFPKDLFEIIVVDNGSTDDTLSVIEKFNDRYPDLVKMVKEDNIQSSYAARNKGIRSSHAEFFAFIDSDCVALNNWLKEGLRILEKEVADLAGGNIEFTFTPKKSAGEMYDSITNMQISDNIQERKVAKTANLFVKSYVFEKIGLFPEDVKSGGDVQWTKRATDRDFKLIFAEKAVVKHPARPLKELLKKQFRVGKGKKELWLRYEKRESPIIYYLIRSLLPCRYKVIKQKIIDKDSPDMRARAFGIWMVSYLATLFTTAGFITEYLGNLFRGNSNENK
jgi:glycosyltransferase involved in cell wall biosynthesis